MMLEILTIFVFMAIVVGLAAGILFVMDRLTLRKDLSEDERSRLVARRTARWQRKWWIFYLSCAAIALILNALDLEHEPVGRRIVRSIWPAIIVIFYLIFGGKRTISEDEDNDEE